MSLRTCSYLVGTTVLAAACTPTHPNDGGQPAPANNPEAEYGPAPAPTFLPRQTLRPGDRDAGRAPVSLTASDGTGLRLVSFKARAVVEEPLAFTELHLVFENPTDRTIEGRFEIDMPPNAAISRFSMKVHGAFQEGEVVERRAAQRAYEDFLHRKQDPALLENKAGNSFSARVFPILPRERKELIVAYSQDLPSSAEPYRLMLRGLPELEELDASVILHEPSAAPAGVTTSLATTTGARRVIELKRSKWTPDQDLEVLDDRGFSMMGLRHDNLAVARVAAVGDTVPAPIEGLTVLFDTSASRALGFESQVARLHEILGSLAAAGDFDLRLVAFDQTTQEIYRGKASGFGKTQLAAIVERGAMGASDLERALAAVAADDAPALHRVLIFSDGISTAGDAELTALKAAALALAKGGVKRIDAIIDGGIQDADVLRQIASAGLAQGGVVLDARLPVDTVTSKLGRSTLPDMKVTIPGANWAWPDTIVGLQPGDEALVYADLPPTAAMRVILTGDDRIDVTVPTTNVERPLLERAWVGARIERLTSLRSGLPASDSDTREAFRRQIIDLSTRFRVLSDFTALLVLETDSDYARFGIDRNALTDILTVDGSGVTLQNRRATPPMLAQGSGTAVADAPTTNDVIPQMARSFDPEMAARQAGILGVMQQESGHFLASPYGGAFAVGNDDADVWGGLTGTEIGEAYGVGGLGLVGTGRGGGGTGEGTIGLGNTDLVGRGGGGGSGSGYGRGPGAGFGGRGRNVPTVRQAKAEVQGAMDRDIIRRIVRAHINEVRYCYNQGLARDPRLRGRVAIQFTIGGTGRVPSAVVQETTLADPAVGNCVAHSVRRWTFPQPDGGGSVIVTYPFVLEPGDGVFDREARQHAAEERREEANERREEAAEERRQAAEAKRRQKTPYDGEMSEVMELVKAGKLDEALTRAKAWRVKDPGDVLALLALGEIHEAMKQPDAAARAYGSIIDLFPSRADLRRYAGARLERIGDDGLALAIDTFTKAVEQRPDHPASHRLLAYALAKAGRHAEALTAILAGLAAERPGGRFVGVDRIFQQDITILAAARIAAEPTSEKLVRSLLEPLKLEPASKPSLRFVLNWETDANDVDFHIHDGQGNRAYYASKDLRTGGELYADVTTGYGPECFAIEGKPAAFPYKLSAHYYSRGPMGYGMGKLQVVQHDGKGGLKFDERPFVIMHDGAFVQLGTVDRPLK